MAVLNFRDVPDDLAQELRMEAVACGMGLRDYCVTALRQRRPAAAIAQFASVFSQDGPVVLEGETVSVSDLRALEAEVKSKTDIGVRAAGKKVKAGKGVKKDACEVCLGAKGGVPGNEVVVDGVVMCDYCHADKNWGEVSDSKKNSIAPAKYERVEFPATWAAQVAAFNRGEEYVAPPGIPLDGVNDGLPADLPVPSHVWPTYGGISRSGGCGDCGGLNGMHFKGCKKG